MINIVLGILIMVMWFIHCIMAIFIKLPIWAVVLISVGTGFQYYWLCRCISEYLTN